MAKIDPPWRLDPLQTLIGSKGKGKVKNPTKGDNNPDAGNEDSRVCVTPCGFWDTCICPGIFCVVVESLNISGRCFGPAFWSEFPSSRFGPPNPCASNRWVHVICFTCDQGPESSWCIGNANILPADSGDTTWRLVPR